MNIQGTFRKHSGNIPGTWLVSPGVLGSDDDLPAAELLGLADQLREETLLVRRFLEAN